jgi:hypothetical protein
MMPQAAVKLRKWSVNGGNDSAGAAGVRQIKEGHSSRYRERHLTREHHLLFGFDAAF